MSPSGGLFDTPKRQKRILEIENEINTDPNFWNDRNTSSKILREKKELEDAFLLINKLKSKFDDVEVLLEFADGGDTASEKEADELIQKLDTEVSELETRRLLSGETDSNSAIVTISAGAGGTEACDWASMIMRMILRQADKRGWKSEIVDELEGDGAGIRNAVLSVEGSFVYGLLKSENGVHRLVRISPYDANARRHTSFCSVFVTPVVDDDIEIEIKTVDLRIDTYRASGAGGQHVNRTDSAVRMTHLPSGIVVQSQSQRSQIQNREMCLKMLKSKLYEAEIERRKAESNVIEDAKLSNSFGSQIRSYVLHPYKLVKDTRTLAQSSDPQAVLDGEIDEFSREFLRQSASGSFKGKGLSTEDME